MRTRAELREEGSVQHYRGNKFPFFPVFVFPIFFPKMPHNLGVHSVSMLSKALS